MPSSSLVGGSWQARAERRRYASDRAGASGRRFARERLLAYARAKWRPFAAITLVLIAFTPLLWFALSPIRDVRGFTLGAYVAAMVAWMYHWMVIASGAASITMGQEGEIWTDQELGRLGSDWRIINHVMFRQGDIDHVAIGPDGVIVIETKWTSSPVRLDGRDRWLGRAFGQAADIASDVRKVLGWGARPDRPVSPLVVVWGTTSRASERRTLPGRPGCERHRWQTTSRDPGRARRHRATPTPPSQIDRVGPLIRRHVDLRDRRDAESEHPLPLPLDQIASVWLARLAVGFAGFVTSSQALRLGFIGFVAAQIVTAAAGAVGLRFKNARPSRPLLSRALARAHLPQRRPDYLS